MKCVKEHIGNLAFGPVQHALMWHFKAKKICLLMTKNITTFAT